MPDRIITVHYAVPVGERSHDWTAVRDSYEPDDPIGYGASEAEAVEDLMERESEHG